VECGGCARNGVAYSEQVSELPESSNRLGKALAFQRREEFQ
jgi:hypothetical protein